MRYFARILLLLVVGLGVVASGCDLASSLSPTETSSGTNLKSLVGVWTSGQGAAAAADACGNLQWRVNSFDGTNATGEFHATCAGNVQVDGTATARLASSTSIQWTASGTAAPQGGGASCGFALGGTATLQTNAVRIDYTGQVCSIPVSGTETLNRK
jgi:hypothetical protein